MYTFQTLLCDYLLRINQLSVISQKIKQSICENSYFQLQTVFERLDGFSNKYLIPADLSEFMLFNQIYPNETELYVIFREFDKQKIGTVLLQDFGRQLLPVQNQKLKTNVLKNKYYPSKLRLQIDLEFLIAKLFRHKIQQHQQLQTIRCKLRDMNKFYSEESFNLIDKQKIRQITVQSLDYFLRSNGKVLKPQQIKRIYNRLNFNQSTKLSKEKFICHLHPLLHGYYLGYAERMVEKSELERDYLLKRYQLQRNKVQSQQIKLFCQIQIDQLRDSQRRIGQIMYEQQQVLKARSYYPY